LFKQLFNFYLYQNKNHLKKTILLLPFFLLACSQPLSNRDKAIQTVKALLKKTDNTKTEFSQLDSVVDYPDYILRQMMEAKRLIMIKQDTLKNKNLYDSLLTKAKNKYYVISYLDKSTNKSDGTWQMVVLDSAFKPKADTK